MRRRVTEIVTNKVIENGYNNIIQIRLIKLFYAEEKMNNELNSANSIILMRLVATSSLTVQSEEGAGGVSTLLKNQGTSGSIWLLL